MFIVALAVMRSAGRILSRSPMVFLGEVFIFPTSDGVTRPFVIGRPGNIFDGDTMNCTGLLAAAWGESILRSPLCHPSVIMAFAMVHIVSSLSNQVGMT